MNATEVLKKKSSVGFAGVWILIGMVIFYFGILFFQGDRVKAQGDRAEILKRIDAGKPVSYQKFSEHFPDSDRELIELTYRMMGEDAVTAKNRSGLYSTGLHVSIIQPVKTASIE